jgi:threonine/homoserine/homoserine lactone efflux protein
VGYGAWMAVATALWFSFVSCVFTRDAARRAFLRGSHWIDRLLGIVFLGFAAGLLLAHV